VSWDGVAHHVVERCSAERRRTLRVDDRQTQRLVLATLRTFKLLVCVCVCATPVQSRRLAVVVYAAAVYTHTHTHITLVARRRRH